LEGLGMEDVGIFYGHLKYFVVIGYVFPVLVFCSQKNLAILDRRRKKIREKVIKKMKMKL
jgi:hypothetical protein